MGRFDTYNKLFDLTGKVALVAGGAGGIGTAVCEGLAAMGATVLVCDRNEEQAKIVADELVKAGGKASGYAVDVENAKGTAQFVEERAKEVGNIDILVNCVGRQIENAAEDYKEEDWDALFATNLKSGFFLSQAVAKVQIRNNSGGKHIHLSSVRSLLGIPKGFVAYCTTKGGMNLMVKQLATEWAKYNINVNAIAPTFIKTEQVARYLNDPDFYNALVNRIPLGRVGQPMDVAGLAMYLAAPASNFVTGQIVFPDGGVTATQ